VQSGTSVETFPVQSPETAITRHEKWAQERRYRPRPVATGRIARRAFSLGSTTMRPVALDVNSEMSSIAIPVATKVDLFHAGE
jgi:hypothetical protein